LPSRTWTKKFPDSFQLWSATALAIKIAAMIVVIWTIYFQDFVLALSQSNTTSLILVVPFLIVYLAYRKRKMLRATIPSERSAPKTKIVKINEIVGAMLSLLAFLLYWQGSFTPYSLQYHIATLPLFVAGLILIIFNAQTLKILALPITFLLFLLPMPLEIVNATGTILATYTSTAVYAILKALGLQLGITTQYGLPAIVLEKPAALLQTLVMDVAFVGTYPLIVFTVIWAFVAFTVRGAAWKRAIMFLAWFPSILVFNTMRITIMTMMAYNFGIAAANGLFYTVGGWFLTLTGTFLFLLFASEKILKIHIFATEPGLTSCSSSSCDQSLENKQDFCLGCGTLLRYIDIKISKRDILKIAALIVIVGLSTFLEVPAFALRDGKIQVVTYLPREGKVDAPVLPEIPGYALSFGYSDERLETIVGPNASLTYVYTPVDGLTPTIHGTMDTNTSEITPLLRGEVLDSRDAEVLQNPPIMGRLVTLHKRDSNFTLVLLYWYERAVFDTESTIVRRQIRTMLFAFSNSSADYTSVEENLLPVGQAVAGYWEPTRAWSAISSLFPEYLYALSVAVVGLIVTFLTVHIMNSKKEKKLNLQAFDRLAFDDEKNVFRAVYQAEKMGKSSRNAIAASFQNLAGRPIDQNTLSDTLRYAEELGLVKSSIANENGEPVLVWKTQIAFPSSKHRLQRIHNLFRTDAFLKRLRH